MVPDKFNMVDMSGIDLIYSQGLAVPGLYDKLMSAISQCRYQCLYNWKFDGIIIPPVYVEMGVNENADVVINGGVSVDENDVLHIYSIERPVYPELEDVEFTENGIYESSEYYGYGKVTVDVPDPPLESLTAVENGTYAPSTGKYGFDEVTVDVPNPPLESLSVVANGTYTPSSGKYGFNEVSVNVPSAQVIFERVMPIKFDENGGYINGGTWYAEVSNNYASDVYEVIPGTKYLLALGATYSNRFRAAMFQTDPTTGSVTVSGRGISNYDGGPYYVMTSGYNYIIPQSGYNYLVAFKSNNGTKNVPTYLFRVSDY